MNGENDKMKWSERERGPDDDEVIRSVSHPHKSDAGKRLVTIEVIEPEDGETNPLWVRYTEPGSDDISSFGVDAYEPHGLPHPMRRPSDASDEAGWLLEYVAMNHRFDDLQKPVEMINYIQHEARSRRREYVESAGIRTYTVDFDGTEVTYGYDPGMAAKLNPPGQAHPFDPGHPPVVVEKPSWMTVSEASDIVEMAIRFESIKGDRMMTLSMMRR